MLLRVLSLCALLLAMVGCGRKGPVGQWTGTTELASTVEMDPRKLRESVFAVLNDKSSGPMHRKYDIRADGTYQAEWNGVVQTGTWESHSNVIEFTITNVGGQAIQPRTYGMSDNGNGKMLMAIFDNKGRAIQKVTLSRK